MTAESASLRLRAPAKVNLGLRLVGRRDDGYHLLESVFAPVGLFDEIEIELRAPATQGSGHVELDLEVAARTGAGLPEALSNITAGPDNLVARAVRAYCAAHGWELDLRMRLEKAIPAGAGLGGGSSDAAAALIGLDQLLGDSGTGASLPEIGLSLGADVPFFLRGGLCHVAGIGEILTPLEDLPEVTLLLANPGVSLDTAEVYRATDALGATLTDLGAGSTMLAFSRLRDGFDDPRETSDMQGTKGKSDGLPTGAARSEQRQALWRDLLVNDLTPAARRLCPPVGRLLEEIDRTGALAASLSGSGATVFGVYGTRAEAESAAEKMRVSRGDPSSAGAEKEEAIPWLCVTQVVSEDRSGLSKE